MRRFDCSIGQRIDQGVQFLACWHAAILIRAVRCRRYWSGVRILRYNPFMQSFNIRQAAETDLPTLLLIRKDSWHRDMDSKKVMRGFSASR